MSRFVPVVASAALLASVVGCVGRADPARVRADITSAAAVDVRPSPEVRFAVEKVSPALVQLDVVAESFSRGQPRTERSRGSGVIIDKEGHILTNFHVAGKARKTARSNGKVGTVEVTLANQEHVKAELIGSDHWTDLAVLKLDVADLKARGLTFSWAPMGDSSAVMLGQPVMALGTPYGLSRTLTAGIISNTERYFDQTTISGYETGWFNNWIQTDAAINPGNSGGPLINLRGEVIGINTRGVNDGNNLGFAIPINVAREVAHKILEHKKVSRSYTGIIFQSMQDLEGFFDSKSGGVLIASVEKDSPAAVAGIKGQDILLAVNDIPVNARFPEQLAPVRKLISDQPVGSSVKLTIRRDKSPRDFQVTTDKLESVVAEEKANRTWGLSVRDVTRAYLREAHLPMLKGVLVTGVTSSLPAYEAKISPDDIILSVNGTAVTNVEEFDEAVKDSTKLSKIKVVVRRDRNEVECVVKPRE